jgi:hypothetical protein
MVGRSQNNNPSKGISALTGFSVQKIKCVPHSAEDPANIPCLIRYEAGARALAASAFTEDSGRAWLTCSYSSPSSNPNVKVFLLNVFHVQLQVRECKVGYNPGMGFPITRK